MKRLRVSFLLITMVTALFGCAVKSPERNLQPAEQNNKIDKLRSTIDSLREKLETRNKQLQSVRKKLNRRTESLKSENRKLKKRLGKIKETTARREGKNLVLTLPERVLFDFGEVSLQETAKTTLRNLGKILKNHPDRPVVVEGHADTVAVVPDGRLTSNWDISVMRASNVVEFVVGETPVNRERVIAAGYGDQHPLVPNTSRANRRKNRRVEIVLYPPDLSRKQLDLSD